MLYTRVRMYRCAIVIFIFHFSMYKEVGVGWWWAEGNHQLLQFLQSMFNKGDRVRLSMIHYVQHNSSLYERKKKKQACQNERSEEFDDDLW